MRNHLYIAVNQMNRKARGERKDNEGKSLAFLASFAVKKCPTYVLVIPEKIGA